MNPTNYFIALLFTLVFTACTTNQAPSTSQVDTMRFDPLSSSHAVHLKVNGTDVPITLLFDDRQEWPYQRIPVRFARMPYQESAKVEVTVGGLDLKDVSIASLEAWSDLTIEGESLSFNAEGAGDYVIKANNTFPLFLFLDTPEANKDIIANRVRLDITNHLGDAPADGDLTETLQSAIDAAAKNPQGAVLHFPAGIYHTGMLHLRSGVYLHLAPGAILRASHDLEKFPILPTRRIQNIGIRTFLMFDGVEDSGILGTGTLDGQGAWWRKRALFEEQDLGSNDMNLVRVENSRNLHFRDTTFQDSMFWNTHMIDSEDMHFHNIKIVNEMPPRRWLPRAPRYRMNNADGINPDGSSNVTMERIFAYCGDNCLPVKNTGALDGSAREVRDITIRHCTLVALDMLAATKIGTETHGDLFENILFEDIFVVTGRNLFNLVLRDTATIRDVTIRNFKGLDISYPIILQIKDRKPDQTAFGHIDGVLIENIEVHSSGQPEPSKFFGWSTEHTLKNITIRNMTVDGENLIHRPDLIEKTNGAQVTVSE